MAQRYTVSMGSGRRERKKLQTRDALLEAAIELFEIKGFEATTVEEIAERVDVSARTFFRYFASKEDVYLASRATDAPIVAQRQLAAMVAELRARPLDEPALTALRRATKVVLEAGERGAYGLSGEHFRRAVLSSAPQARSPESTRRYVAAIAEIIASRMGVSPTDDLRPHVAASLAVGALQSALELMERAPADYFTLADHVDDAFNIIETGANFPCADLDVCSLDSLD